MIVQKPDQKGQKRDQKNSEGRETISLFPPSFNNPDRDLADPSDGSDDEERDCGD